MFLLVLPTLDLSLRNFEDGNFIPLGIVRFAGWFAARMVSSNWFNGLETTFVSFARCCDLEQACYHYSVGLV